MFNEKPLSTNINDKFNDLNAENFTLFGLNLFGKKNKKEVTDAEAAEILNRRRKINAPIIESILQNDPNTIENRIKNKKIKAPLKGYKKPKFDLDGAINTIGSLLAGNASSQPDLSLNEGAELGLDRTGQTNLPNYIIEGRKKNNNTVFYIIIAVLLIAGTLLIIKKKK